MKKKASKKNRITVIFLVAVLLAGLSLLLYPLISNYWNSIHQSQAIAAYMDDVSELDDSAYDALWEEAQDYNTSLLDDENRFFPDEEEQQQYEHLLSISNDGIMGYIEIPSIDVTLPIYHGTSEEVLQVAIGHIEGSSLPIGGPSTHCVISGHRGLPSSRLFTDIDQLSEGDLFTLLVLDETLTYEVDQIRIVEPDDTSLLEIEEGEDLCTLVTCTPYGVNSHRLLVRGHRVENQEAAGILRITADALMIDSRFVAPVLAVPILLVVVLFMVLRPLKRKKRRAAKGEKEVMDR
ncbi:MULTISPECIES: class C sortase [Eubacteriales]|uniref:Class C sortase n=1 Tax=Bittarella massiliensis (ex Durand et al. 2017) TaxID=1720313 RepID=A0AAQ1MDF4_9FIRM|nr:MULTISPECIES: class C sortase [Eubacteriales]ERJ01222.1 sortase family protein [Clostridium sp. ATCC 29733]MZL69077.1 class C sortase [Bittarella massiliensis (ex Durand et al. 2017)]SHG11414.1 sortase A [Bittarella massiliensis (ex Durand et al. 2017)]